MEQYKSFSCLSSNKKLSVWLTLTFMLAVTLITPCHSP